MATHSSVLAWRIPGMVEPHGLPSMGSHRVDTTEAMQKKKKAFDCVYHNNPWEILKEMGIPDHLTCLLKNLYAGQETMVRTRHGTTDWFQIGKGVRQGWILSPW